MSSGGTNTSTTSSAPPPEYTAAFSAANTAAQNVASVPYQNYTGQTVAQLSPDQTTAFGQVENLTANGGVQQPYLTAANNAFTQAAEGIDPQNFATTEAAYQSPYTQQVLNATEAAEMNTDAQQEQQMAGNAVSAGAWGGDRSAVLQGITAGQQALANNTTNAGIEQAGFNQATSTAEANQWLNSQAGAGEANLGSEAQATGLSGASALLQSGGLEQQQAQENLNVPYEQFLAGEAYPFQTTGWAANIAEGLGGASGGTSSTTSPAASPLSQLAGLGVGSVGVLGATGAFGPTGYLTGSGSAPVSALSGASGGLATSTAAELADDSFAHGGMIPRRAPGGGIPDVDVSIMPGATGLGMSPIGGMGIPGADGLGAAPATHGTPDILKNYGATSTTTGGPSELGQLIGLGGQIAASVYGGPVAGAAAGAFNQAVGLREGGMVPHRDVGGGTGMQFKNIAPTLTGQLPKPPDVSMAVVPAPQSTHGGMGIPRAPQAVNPPTLGSTVQSAASGLKGMNPNKATMRTGGMVQRFDTGGGTSAADQPAPWYTPLLQESLDNQMMQSLGLTSADTGMATGGMIPRQHFDVGGMSLGEADPSWTRAAESQSVDRHGLLASPIAGRTDKLAISPISGSYVVPADVISGLGEGNTLAGANVMQRILETGPHGLRMPNGPHKEMGIPRLPPAYREGMGDNGMATGGMVARRAPGGDVDDDGDDNVTYDYAVDSSPELPVPPIPPADGGMTPSGGTTTTTTTFRPNIGPHDTGSPVSNGSRFHTAQADPWLALAEAGFGMAAGKSPHALENIGSGAEQGVKTYVQEKQQANQQNLNADIKQSQIDANKAIWGSRVGVQNDKNDITSKMNGARTDYLQWKAANGSATLAEQQAKQADLAAHWGVLEGIGQQNAGTNAARETDAATNNAARNDIAGRRAATADHAQIANQAIQTRKTDLISQGLDEKKANDQATQEYNQGRLVTGLIGATKNTMTGRTTMDVPQARTALGQHPPSASSQPDIGAIPDGTPISQGGVTYIKRGNDPSKWPTAP